MTSALTPAGLHVLTHAARHEHILSNRDLLTDVPFGQDLPARGHMNGSLHSGPLHNAHLSEPIPALRPFQPFERILPLEHTLPFLRETGLEPGKARYWKRSPELPKGSMLKGFHRLPKAPPIAPVSLVRVECPWAPAGLTMNTTACKNGTYRGAVAPKASWLAQTPPRHCQSTSNHTPVVAVGKQLRYTGSMPVPSRSRRAQNPGVAAARRSRSGNP